MRSISDMGEMPHENTAERLECELNLITQHGPVRIYVGTDMDLHLNCKNINDDNNISHK